MFTEIGGLGGEYWKTALEKLGGKFSFRIFGAHHR